MNQRLITELANGRAAVLNNGTKDDLVNVLTAAFPDYAGPNVNNSSEKYYYKDGDNPWWTAGIIESVFPAYSVKEYLHREYKWSDRIQVYYNNQWKEGVYIAVNPYKYEEHIVQIDGVGMYPRVFEQIRIPVIEKTKQQIADKFGIPVEQLVIKD